MKNIFRFLKTFHPEPAWAAAGIVLSLTTQLANIGLMAVAGWFIAAMGLAGAAGVTMNYFTPAACIRALAITRTVGRYAERLVTHDATLRMTAKFRPWLYAQIEPLAPEGVAAYHSSELFGRLRSDVDILERFYLSTVAPICVAALGLTFTTATVAVFAPLFSLALLGCLFIGGICVPILLHVLARKRYSTIASEQTNFRLRVSEYVSGMGELAVYHALGRKRYALLESSNRALAQQQALARLQAWGQASTAALSGVTVILALILGTRGVAAGSITPPMLAALPLFALACLDFITPLPAALQNLQAANDAAGRIFEIVDKAAALQPPNGQLPAAPHFSLAFSDVTFRYNNNDAVLKQLSFSLNAGEVLSIAGPSGVGKSTICALLIGMYGLQIGDIRANGRSIRDCDPDIWRRQFAVAEQRPYIFLGTFRSNLLLAKPDATQVELEAACATAGILPDIMHMPDGFDTYLGEGGKKLSGGQIRRLAIARALLKDAPCLILDEPEEGLGHRQARDILQTILDACTRRGKAVILISHDPSVLKGRTCKHLHLGT